MNNLPHTRRRSPHPRALVLVAAVLFGTTGTAQAFGPATSPVVVGAARIAVGAVLLWLVAAVLDRRRAAATPPWPRLAVGLAGACVAGYQLLFFAAVAGTGVAVGTVVALGSAPVFAGLLARAVAGARLERRWALGTALATAGVAVLVAGGAAATVSVVGVALALGSGLMYAGYTVGAKRLLDAGHPPEAVMARAFGTGALLLVPVLVVGAGELASPSAIGLALYLGALPTALAYVLFARGLRSLPAADVATLTLAEPLTAAALGVVVLGERLSPAAAAGALLVLSGLVALGARRPQPLAPLSGRAPVQDPAA